MAEYASSVKSPAQRIFALCDEEGKGFVTKKDMLERLQNQLPLNPEQLEVVFNSLDSDANGTLTFEEFVQGFGVYLEEEKAEVVPEKETPEPSVDGSDDIINHKIIKLIESLGAGDILQDENLMKQLFELLRDQEEKWKFLERILEKTSQLVQSKDQERTSMEDYMRQQIEAREEEHRKMYEEMELQIAKEFKRVDLEGRMREAAITHELTEDIMKKKQLIDHLRTREQELEETLAAVREGANAAKHQITVLLKEKKFMEGQLEMQTRLADDFRGVCERLRRENVAERRQRAMAALAVAQDIAVERAGLVSQLHMLRAINTRLMDESDMRKWGSMSENENDRSSSSIASEELKQAEVDDEYRDDGLKNVTEDTVDDDLELNEKPKSLFEELSMWVKPVVVDVTLQTDSSTATRDTQTDAEPSLSEKTISVADLRDRVTVEASEPPFNPCLIETSFAYIPSPCTVTSVSTSIGYHSGRWTHGVNIKRRELLTPSSVFKIIVLGVDGVGKSSFIRRFCCGENSSSKSAPGIDWSVRCLPIGDDQQIALQFWDAPGKTRQHQLRQLVCRSDAVLVMYDVTSESSLKEARRWMLDAEGAPVRALIGNKVDLLEAAQSPEEDPFMTVTLTRIAERVPTAAALQLAESAGWDLFETSATSGYMVHETLAAVAAKLLVKERLIAQDYKCV